MLAAILSRVKFETSRALPMDCALTRRHILCQVIDWFTMIQLRGKSRVMADSDKNPTR